MPRCVWCGQEIDLTVKIGRLDECTKCHRDLHACIQCRFYDRAAHNDCREPQAGWVADKERANFCGFFEPGRDREEEMKEQEKVKGKLEDLFKK